MARVALVTGGTRGIGKAIVQRLKEDGMQVAAGYSGNAEAAEATARELGVMVVKGNVGSFEDCQRAVAEVEAQLGPIDVLINNAGITRDGFFHKMSAEQWSDVIRVNMDSVFNMTRQVINGMRDRGFGRIVNISSINGQKGQIGQTNYSAAKAGIVGLTLVQSAEFARYGVTANAIAPAARTRMTEAVFADTMAAPEPGAFDAMAPENISPLVVWLGSADSAGITGRVFEVEGGKLSVADAFQHGPSIDEGRRWDPADVGPAIRELLDEAPTPAPVYGAS